jgi:FlaA1/EpsC-like NDP-sugar epimerase
VTVTHREITRYFMTIPEAAQLVIQAGAMAIGGEVFVLDMGEPVKVVELAVRMIELSGLKVRDSECPQGDIEIQFTGLRPGEKLYEELLIGDNPTTTGHPRVMMARENFLPWSEFLAKFEQLRMAAEAQDFWRVRQILVGMVPEYVPAAQVVDWVLLEEEKAAAAVRPEAVRKHSAPFESPDPAADGPAKGKKERVGR